MQIGNGKPPSSVTPRSKPISFIAIWPWSWYIVSTASNAPLVARTNTVSGGNGPSAVMPSCLRRFDGGADDLVVFMAKIAAVSRMGVKARDGDAGHGEPGLAQRRIGQPDVARALAAY